MSNFSSMTNTDVSPHFYLSYHIIINNTDIITYELERRWTGSNCSLAIHAAVVKLAVLLAALSTPMDTTSATPDHFVSCVWLTGLQRVQLVLPQRRGWPMSNLSSMIHAGVSPRLIPSPARHLTTYPRHPTACPWCSETCNCSG